MGTYAAAPLIKEIGRGKEGARSLSREQARELYGAMLRGEVSDLHLGAILLSMRIKGESVDELAGFMDGIADVVPPLDPVARPLAPVIIPTYNGARHMANLTPLLAMLLAREGVPVLVHGTLSDPVRVTTAAIFEVMGIAPSCSRQSAQARLGDPNHLSPVFLPIGVLSPELDRLLALRAALGVRNSTHTLVKMLQPLALPSLRLVSYTHPEYFDLQSRFFSIHGGDCLLMRGTEGETVANAKRAQRIDWYHAGHCVTLREAHDGVIGELPVLPAGRDAPATAVWIQAVLSGALPIPTPIQDQIDGILQALGHVGTA